MTKVILSITFTIFSLGLLAQGGGSSTFNFLNITNSAKVASLGGQQVSITDEDFNLVFHNPSLLSAGMDQQLVLNYVNYFPGINLGYVAYAWKPEKKHTIGVGLHYLNYGEFEEANSAGIKLGTFRAADYAFNFFWARPLIDSVLDVGFNFKPIFSQYESYTSLGLVFDAGLTYHGKTGLFSAGLVFKNIGGQITKYNPDDTREPMPFEIQLGITQKLRHAPFRFSVIAHHLNKPNLLYETAQDINDNIDPATGQPKEADKLGDFADNLMRHINFGIEFVPSNKFYIALGYNYKRRQEMKIKDRAAMVGFSYGFGMKIRRFNFSYGRATYHLAGASNHISITTNLSDFGAKL